MIAKPHGNSCPEMCSQCRGAVPTRVEQRADVLLIDGVEVRSVSEPAGFQGQTYRKRRRR